MGGVALGILALILAWVFIRFQIGPDWLALRIGALLALVGAQAVIAPTVLGDWLRAALNWLGSLLGRLVGEFDGSLGAAVTAVFLPALVLIVAILWLGAMISSRASKHIGGIANQEYSSNLIWGGAIILGVFATAAPGELGNVLGSLVDILAQAGRSGVQWAVA